MERRLEKNYVDNIRKELWIGFEKRIMERRLEKNYG